MTDDAICARCGCYKSAHEDDEGTLYCPSDPNRVFTLSTPAMSDAPVDVDAATLEQIQRANNAVTVNLNDDGLPKYDSGFGYACALTAIMQSDALLDTSRAVDEPTFKAAPMNADKRLERIARRLAVDEPTPELRECPHCGQGGPTKVYYGPDLSGHNPGVRCVCGAAMRFGDKESTIAAWNRRAVDEPTEAMVAAGMKAKKECRAAFYYGPDGYEQADAALVAAIYRAMRAAQR